MIKKKIGFIGAGNMAEALINGIIKSSLFSIKNIAVYDTNKLRTEFMREEYELGIAKNNVELAKKSDIIVLAVKPKHLGEALDEIKDCVDEEKILISIAAGINVEFIQQRFSWDHHVQIVRVMPNTPALVLAGASGLYFNANCRENTKEIAKKIFDSVGITAILDKEDLIDAVTALSGSGPAYVFYFMEALSDAGVLLGLSRDLSQALAIQTIYGSSLMAKEKCVHPTILKEMVTSPGGTTIEALKTLDMQGVKGSIMEAVRKACKKAKKLSES